MSTVRRRTGGGALARQSDATRNHANGECLGATIEERQAGSNSSFAEVERDTSTAPGYTGGLTGDWLSTSTSD